MLQLCVNVPAFVFSWQYVFIKIDFFFHKSNHKVYKSSAVIKEVLAKSLHPGK